MTDNNELLRHIKTIETIAAETGREELMHGLKGVLESYVLEAATVMEERDAALQYLQSTTKREDNAGAC